LKPIRTLLALAVAGLLWGTALASAARFVTQDRAKSAEPPKTWKEHWFEHEQLVKLVAFNEEVAIYFDDDMPRPAMKWIEPFLTKAWRYTKKTYGSFGPDARLFAIFHQGKYGGGHPSTYFDESHDNRNVIDCGADSWDESRLDLVSHEIGHIVEGASNGVHESPAFDIWKDSKWIELYQYDLYVALRLDKAARRTLESFSQHPDDFPRRGTHWFRDFFHPLWRDHGRARLMVSFFRLLAKHFPQEAEQGGKDRRFTRRMNWGEFIHFMSGAAGKDVRPVAKKAFGWPVEWEKQYKEALAAFPEIHYGK
jgi:hypothetical protein